jgi:hypothetical protein
LLIVNLLFVDHHHPGEMKMGRKGRGSEGEWPRIWQGIFERGFAIDWFSIKILTGFWNGGGLGDETLAQMRAYCGRMGFAISNYLLIQISNTTFLPNTK